MATINRKFGRKLLRTRNAIEKRGITMAFKAIKEQYNAVSERVGMYSNNKIIEMLPFWVKPDSIQLFIEKFYPMSAKIGVMYRERIFSGKEIDDYERWINLYEEQLRRYGLLKAGQRITSITETTEQFIRGAIESAITDAAENGLGVEKTSELIRKYLKDSLGDVGRARARMIAQTELITASNQASVFAAESTGYNYRKFWVTSGLTGIRDSHIYAQDNYPNGIAKDESFNMGNGNFMLHPGDPAGPAEEVINCRCWMDVQIV